MIRWGEKYDDYLERLQQESRERHKADVKDIVFYEVNPIKHKVRIKPYPKKSLTPDLTFEEKIRKIKELANKINSKL